MWGHTITDQLRFIWFLTSEVFKREFKNCPIVYTTYNGHAEFKIDAQPDCRRLLEILGVKVEELRCIDRPTQFDKIILPDECFFPINFPVNSLERGFTVEYREMIERVRHFALKNRTPTSNKKFFFFNGRSEVGENHLAEYFKSKGYEIIPHEKRANFDEEMNLLINAESFAAPLGSCSHNSIFMRDNTEAIFIPRATSYTFHQEALNQVHPINAIYIDSTLSIFNAAVPLARCYFYIISEQLKRFFGDKWVGYEEEDFKIFLEYVKDNVRKGMTPNLQTKEYYVAILSDFMAQLKQHKKLIASYDMPPRWEEFQPFLTYQTHVHMRGWGDGWKVENKPSNPLDQMLDILAIKVNFPNHKVYYSVYFNDKEGWSQEVLSPEMAGTVGIRKPIYGMRVRLDEADAKEFDILYRMHTFDGEWTPWAKNGENLYSHKQRLNAIQIKLEPVKSVEANSKQIDNPQALLLKDDAIYLQGQRQNLMQLKFKLT